MVSVGLWLPALAIAGLLLASVLPVRVTADRNAKIAILVVSLAATWLLVSVLGPEAREIISGVALPASSRRLTCWLGRSGPSCTGGPGFHGPGPGMNFWP